MLDVTFLLAALRLTAPLALASLGGVLTERSGIIALHLESCLLAGAYSSVAVASGTGNPLLGLLAGAFAGAVVGLLHTVLCLTFRVPHILSGVALNLGAVGVTTYLLRQSGGLETRATLPPLLPFALVIVASALCWFYLFRTAGGLRLRACGENPTAATSSGIAVNRYRFGAAIVGGAFAGMGGVALTLTGLGTFTENMTQGRGYIALAAVIFGRWNPVLAALTALLFGAGDALQLTLQTAGLARVIPPDLLSLFPYLLTLLALAFFTARNNAPAALGATDP